MCHGVLDNDGLNALGIRQGQTKAYRTTVILQKKAVLIKSKQLGEFIDHLGEMIESVVELLRVGSIAMSEARIVWSNQMIGVGEPSQQWLVHSR